MTGLIMAAAPALADKLVFDHRLVPALKAVLDAGDPAMTAYNGRNPANLINVMAVRGRSASDWDEALIIITRVPDPAIASPDAWQAQIARDAARQCPAVITPVARDSISITFERRSTGCRKGYPAVALYRVVQGRSLFLLAALSKTDFTPERRAEWLALMASGRIE